MKFCVVISHGSEYEVVADVSYPNILLYCNKWGLDLYKTEIDYTEGKRKWVWNKLKIAAEILPLYHWIVMLDTDLVVMDDSVDIRKFVDNDYCMVVGENSTPDDWFTEFPANLELGVIFLRNYWSTFEILKSVYSDSENCDHPWAEHKLSDEAVGENSIYDKKVKRVPHREFNSLSKCYEEGDFIYHVGHGGGASPEKKAELLKNPRKYP